MLHKEENNPYAGTDFKPDFQETISAAATRLMKPRFLGDRWRNYNEALNLAIQNRVDVIQRRNPSTRFEWLKFTNP